MVPKIGLALILAVFAVGAVAAQNVDAPGASGPNIPCDRMESVLFHHHAHLAIYVYGSAQEVPRGIGIGQPWETVPGSDGPVITGGSCFSWLHTHSTNGILHVEAPIPRTFTLGDFFAVWGQPLGTSQAAWAAGPVVAYVDGIRVDGDPSAIVLANLQVIQLNVGLDSPPPQPYTFPARYAPAPQSP